MADQFSSAYFDFELQTSRPGAVRRVAAALRARLGRDETAAITFLRKMADGFEQTPGEAIQGLLHTSLCFKRSGPSGSKRTCRRRLKLPR